MTEDTLEIIVVAVAATLVAIAVVVMLYNIAAKAFSTEEKTGKLQAFNAFFHEILAMTTVVFIVVAGFTLAEHDKIKGEAAVTLLSGVAGYVLGSRNRRTDMTQHAAPATEKTP